MCKKIAENGFNMFSNIFTPELLMNNMKYVLQHISNIMNKDENLLFIEKLRWSW